MGNSLDRDWLKKLGAKDPVPVSRYEDFDLGKLGKLGVTIEGLLED